MINTTHRIVERELQQTARLNRRVRRMLEERLSYIQRYLNAPDLHESRMPRLSEELREILKVSSDQIIDTSKLLLTTAKSSSPPTDSSPTGEEIVNELVSGKQKQK